LIKSVSFSARSVREPESARTKRIASIILLLPEPFGPEMTEKPS